MDRIYLTAEELRRFKIWASRNNFDWKENPSAGVAFEVSSGKFSANIITTNDPELFEILDLTDRQTARGLLCKFYTSNLYMLGVEIENRHVKKFVDEDILAVLPMFDHFRLIMRTQHAWSLVGCVGIHSEVLAKGGKKMATKFLGPNFLEEYWKIIYSDARTFKATPKQ